MIRIRETARRFDALVPGFLWILVFGLKRNPPAGALLSTLPGPGDMFSVFNVYFEVVAAAVLAVMPRNMLHVDLLRS